MSSARRSTPLGVPTDLQSVVKKVRPIKPGDLQSPYSIDMPANAWGLGITYPQSIKRLGHFLTADYKSAGTPNGGKDISSATERAYPALRKSAGTPNGGKAYPALRRFAIPLSHRYAGYCLVAGDNISPEHKVVRTFFDGGLQIRRDA